MKKLVERAEAEKMQRAPWRGSAPLHPSVEINNRAECRRRGCRPADSPVIGGKRFLCRQEPLRGGNTPGLGRGDAWLKRRSLSTSHRNMPEMLSPCVKRPLMGQDGDQAGSQVPEISSQVSLWSPGPLIVTDPSECNTLQHLLNYDVVWCTVMERYKDG